MLKAFRAFYAALKVAPLPVELVNDTGDLILGVFRKDRRTVVVHVQHFQPAWEKQEAMDPLPPTSGAVTLRWNGKTPKSVRLALPEPGQPIMPIKKGASTLITMPAFVRGQIVLIES